MTVIVQSLYPFYTTLHITPTNSSFHYWHFSHPYHYGHWIPQSIINKLSFTLNLHTDNFLQPFVLYLSLFLKDIIFLEAIFDGGCSFSYTYISHEQWRHLPFRWQNSPSSTLKWYPAHWTNNIFLALTPYLSHILLDCGSVSDFFFFNLLSPEPSRAFLFAFFVNPTWLVDTTDHIRYYAQNTEKFWME